MLLEQRKLCILFFIYLSMTVCCYNNEIKYAAWVRVIIVLTFGFYIVYTHRCWWGCIFYGQQYMAAGHRCSYRHNVCQPLQAVIANVYNCRIYRRG